MAETGTKSPRVSVIIPVYNGAGTLDECLATVLGSTWRDLEVVVVNDGSTDATAQIARRWADRDSRCRVIDLPQNAGAARAKNIGAQHARGEILFFTDADIRVPAPLLSYVLEDLADPRVDGVVGLLGQSCPYHNFASEFKNLWMHFTYRRQPREVGLFFTSAAAIRREIFAREGGFDSHYQGASITEDIELGQRLRAKGYRLVLDQRATVEHCKHYTLGEVLRTDLLRARGLMLTWLRNHLPFLRREAKALRAHYASVPWYFGAGVLAMGMATLLGLAALILGSGFWALMALLAVLAALALNAPFLSALARWRGGLFALRSAGFLLLDLYASGLGIVLGFIDLLRGKRY
ncbi:MAG: glycosyltransferase family 2 protein [Chloroflexi bacterium]|nr:glycosyltransferase family 2 protein [Chloroflexota bacterium]